MLQCFDPDESVEAGTEIKELEGEVFGEGHDGDEVSLEESDGDKVFLNVAFLQAARPRPPPRNKRINFSIILLDSEFIVCTFINARLV